MQQPFEVKKKNQVKVTMHVQLLLSHFNYRPILFTQFFFNSIAPFR